MKSMSTTAYGAPEVIQEVHLPTPEPAAGEITIDVRYVAVGLIDAIIRRGTFADLDYVPKPSNVPGLEVRGRVRALGEGVTALSIGERASAFPAVARMLGASRVVVPSAPGTRLKLLGLSGWTVSSSPTNFPTPSTTKHSISLSAP